MAKKRKSARSGKGTRSASLKETQASLEGSLLRAMNAANAQGYTGYFGGKGSLFDCPKVRKAKAAYDRFLARVHRKSAK